MSISDAAVGEPIAGPEPRTGNRAELLDVCAVAALLGCSARHVYRMADAGRMPRPLRLGALVRWRRGELTEWIERGCPSVRTARGGAQ